MELLHFGQASIILLLEVFLAVSPCPYGSELVRSRNKIKRSSALSIDMELIVDEFVGFMSSHGTQ